MRSYFLMKYNEALRHRERRDMHAPVKGAVERVIEAYKKCAKLPGAERRLHLGANR